MKEWTERVVQAGQGDLHAFDAVVKEFQDMAVGYAYSVLQDFHLAEDAAQEAFVEAFSSLRQLKEPKAFPAWFRKVVFKHCDRITRRKQHPSVDLDHAAEIADPGPSPFEAVSQRETQEMVLAAVNALPEHERVVTTLAYVNGYSLAEVGDFLEVSTDAVKSRLQSARGKLRERMVGLVEETMKHNAPGDGFSERVRAVLSGVRRIGFYSGEESPEDHAVPAVMRASMEYLGNDCGFKGRLKDRASWKWAVDGLIHGVSGTGFQFTWNSRACSTEDAYLGPELLSMYEHAFQAVGYAYEPLLRTEFASPLNYHGARSDDETEFRRRIIESIGDAERPVIALGIFGPPQPCLITGYDENGDALIGWNFFQDEGKDDPRVSFEPSGCFRKRDWFRDVQGILIIGEKTRKADRKRVYLSALKRGLETLCFQGTKECPAGIAAYTDWVYALLDDARYPEGSSEALKEHVWEVGDPTGDLAERRCFAEAFLIQAADLFPEVKDQLRLAADYYQVIHDMVWRFWQTQPRGADSQDDLSAYVPADIRRELASIVQLQRAKDLEAAKLIRRALVKLGVAESDLASVPSVPDALPGTRGIMPELVSRRTEPTVKFANLDRYVDGVPKFDGWNTNVCSFARSLEAAMAPTEHPYSYMDLMGYSGLAFRTRWFSNPSKSETAWRSTRWHPVSPHDEQVEEVAATARATGWRLRMADLPTDDHIGRARLITDAVLSINVGLPVVVGYNTDLGVLYSYHVWNQTLLIRDVQRSDQTEVRIPFGDPNIHSPFIFLTEHTDPLPERDAFLDALSIAVQDGRREHADGFRFGLAALDTWREDLAAFDTYTEEEREFLFMTNWRRVLHLADARQSAVAFLEQRKGLLAGKTADALRRVQDLYRQEADLVNAFAKENRDLVQWWGGGKTASDWAPGVRRRQMEMLTQCRALEEMALGFLDEVIECEMP